jgi:hypothetical protein
MPPALLLLAALLFLPAPAEAALDLPGVDLRRPRIAFRSQDLPTIQARLDGREPYRTVVADMVQRIALAERYPLDDTSIEGHRCKARAAKDLAFLFAVNRTLVDGQVVPFPTEADRQAAGDRVRDLLLNLFPHSRLGVAPPDGGWDRDISTSEELLQYATAFDALLGAGYDFGDAEAEIVELLVDFASEFYDHYTDPGAYGGALEWLWIHQNNHRSKSGAALAIAALALAEYQAPPGTDPKGIREPAAWLAYGLGQVDRIMRYALVAADGAYGEGPFYFRFACQNLHPFLRAWDRLTGGADFDAGGVTLPSLWRHPLFLRGQRWVLDMTLPDGSLAHIDDGNPWRSFYFGSAPRRERDAAAFAWRWANAPTPFETDGNIDMGPDAIAVYDDSVVPAPPSGSPTAIYVEGGNAIFRSDWSREGVVAVVLGEHGPAASFGRDRDGLGVGPQSHEHAEPGAFMMHAFGERLALDPGYVSFFQRYAFNSAEHHNAVLVGGRGPTDYLAASGGWMVDPAGPPPAEGMATLSENLDSAFLDATRVTARYGDPAALLRRRFLFPDHRYLVIADHLESEGSPAPDYTFLLHGNGGGTSGGSFEPTAAGGRWTQGGARLDGAFASASGVLAPSTALAEHELPGKQVGTHVVVKATSDPGLHGAELRALQIVYPSRSAEAPPELGELALPGAAALSLLDAAGDRRLLAVHRSGQSWSVAHAQSGLGDVESDGHLALFDAHLDGRLRLAWVEGATHLAHGGTRYFETVTPGAHGLALHADRAELVVGGVDPSVQVKGLPFRPGSADGACGLDLEHGDPVLVLGRERRVTLRPGAGNSAPAADPGPMRRVAPGELVVLDGTASCDADADDLLTPSWELVAAPQGSAWSLDRADTWNPWLQTDRPGPYRVRLVVTDSVGAESLEAEVLIVAGDPCEDSVDGDLDGLIDTADPDCDRSDPVNAAPTAEDDAYRVAAGARFEALPGVLENDGDAEGDPRVAVPVSPPAHGRLWLRPDGSFEYTPDAGFAGEDGFRYLARDAHGAESEAARVAFQVVVMPELDIEPRRAPNLIRSVRRGVISVAILTTAEFDASEVDVESVRFGPAAAKKRRARRYLKDVDRDGDLDLLLHFRTAKTGIRRGDTEACLSGETLGSLPLFACDSVSTERRRR